MGKTDGSTVANQENFYDELDLKYPEIAIAMQAIDRTNPGVVQFSIPILTPTMNNSSPSENTVHQTNSNIQNGETQPEIDNIEVSNYVSIRVPKELCAFVGGWFDVEGGSNHSADGTYQESGNLSGSGGIGETSLGVSYSSSGTEHVDYTNVQGEHDLMPQDRYIPKGSKWIVVFLGGDVTKPRIIGRAPDD